MKCFVLLIFLNYVCGASLTVSSINESKVKSYSVLRRNDSIDYFTVKFKDGDACAVSGQIWRWCKSLSAFFDKSWENGTSCSCTCPYAFSFLSPLQKCINATSANKFGGECV